MKTTLPKVWIFGTPLLALLFVFAPHALRSLAQDQAPPATTEQAVAPANPPAPAELPSDIVPGSPVAQVVEMAQAGVSESVIISFVNASAAPFNLTADDIIYLKDIGLSDNVVNAMIQRDQQLGVQIATPNDTPPPPPVASTAVVAQPAVVTDTYFYDNLAPYGSWVNIQGYGLCWQPTVVVLDPGWRPYCDRGHWVYTDDGWFWMSDYSWGWATFHYGRWFHHPHYGWCWWPDTVWGPSWVTWRYSNDYCGWAPLPPHAIYRSGVGIVYNGVVVGAGFDFGLGVSFYTFVPTRHFCDRDPWRYRVHDRPEVFRETVVVNRFDTRHREFQNRGIDPDHIVAVTGKPIRAVPVRETTARLPGRARLEHDALVVNRPRFAADSSLTLHQGIVPRPEPSRVETRPRVQPDTSRPSIFDGRNAARSIRAPERSMRQPTIQRPQTPVTRDVPRVQPQYNDSLRSPNYLENTRVSPSPYQQLMPSYSRSDNRSQRYVSPRMQPQTPRVEPRVYEQRIVPAAPQPAPRFAPSQNAPMRVQPPPRVEPRQSAPRFESRPAAPPSRVQPPSRTSNPPARGGGGNENRSGR